MISRFIVHHHRAGKAHFDLRVLHEELFRSWSLLKEPPRRPGEQRLAIERESFSPEALLQVRLTEDAFGEGRIHIWDEGEVEIASATPKKILLLFKGQKLVGRYEMHHMHWYPGNRWLLKKVA